MLRTRTVPNSGAVKPKRRSARSRAAEKHIAEPASGERQVEVAVTAPAEPPPAVSALPPAALALAAEVFQQVLTEIFSFMSDAARRRCGQVCRRWREEVNAINAALTKWINVVPGSAENQFTASAEITFHGVSRCAAAPPRKRDYLWSPQLAFRTESETGLFCFCVRLGSTPDVMSTFMYPLQPNWLKDKSLTFTLLFPTGAASLSKAAYKTRKAQADKVMICDHALRKDGLGYQTYCNLSELPDRAGDTLSFIVEVKDSAETE